MTTLLATSATWDDEAVKRELVADLLGAQHFAWHHGASRLALELDGELFHLQPPGQATLWARRAEKSLRWFGDTLAYCSDGWVSVLFPYGENKGGGVYRLPNASPGWTRQEPAFAADGVHLAWIERRPPHVRPDCPHRLRVGCCFGEEVKLLAESPEFWAENCLRPMWTPTSTAIAVTTPREVKEWSFDGAGLIPVNSWIPEGDGFATLVFHPQLRTKVALRGRTLTVQGSVENSVTVAPNATEVSVGGDLVAVGHDTLCDLFDLTLRSVGQVELPQMSFHCRYALSPDGRWLACSMLGSMRLYRFPPPSLPRAVNAATDHEEPHMFPSVPRCDIGILTIKDEEFEAALNVFPDDPKLYEAPESKRHYNFRTADAGRGASYRIAIVRHVEKGTGDAQTTARDMIEDIDPRLILVVGIAGGRPTVDFTLGDVILSMRVHDYTVHASSPGKDDSYASTGGPIAGEIQKGVANLKARGTDLGDWAKALPPRPSVDLEALGLNGAAEWQDEVRESIQHHFRDSPREAPIFTAGALGSSDGLIKDPDVLIAWLRTARDLLAIEMEAAGVYRAARDRCAMLAIRGISDIVGLERDERWTKYAACSAAAFARAYLRTTPVAPTSESQTGAAAPNPR